MLQLAPTIKPWSVPLLHTCSQKKQQKPQGPRIKLWKGLGRNAQRQKVDKRSHFPTHALSGPSFLRLSGQSFQALQLPPGPGTFEFVVVLSPEASTCTVRTQNFLRARRFASWVSRVRALLRDCRVMTMTHHVSTKLRISVALNIEGSTAR